MPASTTLLQRLLAAAAALSLVAAVGANASIVRAITAPTITVIDINPEGGSYALDNDDKDGVAVNGMLLFRANDGIHGRDLYKSDGTVAGTVLVKDINPTGDSSPVNMVAMGTTAYFRADDGTNGFELWKSNGTEVGTVMVKNINPGGDSYPSELTVLGSTLYFKADDGTNDNELWKSDGTEAGTVMVKDINPTGSANVGALTRHGGLLYFQGYDGVNGDEMYLSDGTEEGTMRIPGPNGSNYVDCDCYENPVRATSNGVFFTYDDDTVGNELGFIADRLPETNTSGNALALALLALSGALAAGAVIARSKELRAN